MPPSYQVSKKSQNVNNCLVSRFMLKPISICLNRLSLSRICDQPWSAIIHDDNMHGNLTKIVTNQFYYTQEILCNTINLTPFNCSKHTIEHNCVYFLTIQNKLLMSVIQKSIQKSSWKFLNMHMNILPNNDTMRMKLRRQNCSF